MKTTQEGRDPDLQTKTKRESTSRAPAAVGNRTEPKLTAKHASQRVLRPAEQRKRRSRYVAALDGLRAFAVLAVIFYHMGLGWAPGGLMGVTVFFVISGYLINGLLVAEFEGSGTISLPQFWLRRVRRIIPAVLLALAGTLVLCALVSPALFAKARSDLLPSLFFFNNWWQIFHNVSYFEAAAAPSPLTHYWSLAIEEQFYIVWPLLLLALFKLRVPKKTIAAIVAVLAAASIGEMALLYSPSADPSRIYYGTDTRAASLLIGAFLALVWPSTIFGHRRTQSHSAGSRAAFNVVGAGALTALVVVVATTSSYTSFPYRGGIALVSVLTALLIAVLVVPNTWVARLLQLKPLVWIGKRSYGMYLWHYPIILATSRITSTIEVPWWVRVAQLVIIFAISDLSFRFVETPIRTGALRRWWESQRSAQAAAASAAGRRSDAPSPRHSRQRPLTVPTIAVCAVLFCGAIASLAIMPPATSAVTADSSPSSPSSTAAAGQSSAEPTASGAATSKDSSKTSSAASSGKGAATSDASESSASASSTDAASASSGASQGAAAASSASISASSASNASAPQSAASDDASASSAGAKKQSSSSSASVETASAGQESDSGASASSSAASASASEPAASSAQGAASSKESSSASSASSAASSASSGSSASASSPSSQSATGSTNSQASGASSSAARASASEDSSQASPSSESSSSESLKADSTPSASASAQSPSNDTESEPAQTLSQRVGAAVAERVQALTDDDLETAAAALAAAEEAAEEATEEAAVEASEGASEQASAPLTDRVGEAVSTHAQALTDEERAQATEGLGDVIGHAVQTVNEQIDESMKEAEQQRREDAYEELFETEHMNAAGSLIFDPLLIGDSVAAGCENEFYRTFPYGHSDAEVNRNVWESPYLFYEENDQVGEYVVFCLGTNNAVVDEQIDEMLSVVGSDKKVILVNIRCPRDWETQTNRAIADAPSRHSNVVAVADWYGASAGHDEYFYEDGIHVNSVGAKAYISLIQQTIKDSLE